MIPLGSLIWFAMRTLLVALCLHVALVPAAVAHEDGGGKVDFSRDILPILSDRCFECHGPDEAERKADLRLDTPEGAFEDLGGYAAFVPGNLDDSEAWQRILLEGSGRMPPVKSGLEVSIDERDALRRWIEEGAVWERHWAFVPPVRPEVPEVEREDWPRNPIDHFILARLEAEGLQPSQAASPETLQRRMGLDLIGLPPTLEEQENFHSASSELALASEMERLFASPHFGERMALEWLDAARYADTNGYHRDASRTMWLWRDWVIDAFNENKPYDEFVVEQLAGDLLPDATIEQRIATGFNRNHMINDEGGAIAEEYQVEYVVDRVRTTSTVFMGLTMGCAQCHDHKYDPVTHEDYYRFYAFFNKLPERGLDGTGAPAVPALSVPQPEQEREIARVDERMRAIEARMEEPQPELDLREANWTEGLATKLEERWEILRPNVAKSTGGAELEVLEDHSILVSGKNPDTADYEVGLYTSSEQIRALRLELLTHESFAHNSVARTTHGNLVLSELVLEASSLRDPSQVQTVEFTGAVADYSQDRYPVAYAIDGKRDTGWAVDGHELIENRSALFFPKEPFGYPGGTVLRAKLGQYFGTKHTLGRFRFALSTDPEFARAALPTELSAWSMAVIPGDASALYFEPVELAADLDFEVREELTDGEVHALKGTSRAFVLRRTLTAPTARELELSLGSDDSLVVRLNGELVHENPAQRGARADQDRVTLELPAGESTLTLKVVNYGGPGGFSFAVRRDGIPVMPCEVTAAARVEPGERTERQSAALRDYFRRNEWEEWALMTDELAKLEEERSSIEMRTPSMMVMRDEPGVRDTMILERGRYDRPVRKVVPGVPSSLPPLTARGDEADRLDLARWLVDPEHPLTARVAVNRLWQTIFGEGLVTTSEDFGLQGAYPSHPELLDWLAVEFIESGFDVKQLLSLMVSSATYRQSSRVTPELLERDPENRLCARAPRFRLAAELVRDNALAIAGLLNRELKGPSVRPYQPAGLWAEISFNNQDRADSDFYTPDVGANLYRRGLYTFWKRALPPPALQTLDAPTREVCVVRRGRTNTPLQALVLMNDPTYVEAARSLAQRVLREGGDDEAGLELAFRCAVAREPSEAEQSLLQSFLDEERARFRDDPERAEELVSVGDSMRDADLPVVEHAAWTALCSLILNLDETLNRN